MVRAHLGSTKESEASLANSQIGPALVHGKLQNCFLLLFIGLQTAFSIFEVRNVIAFLNFIRSTN